MDIQAVVFDIGGVLELTPPTGWIERWEARLQLEAGELDARLSDVWRAGRLGLISEADVEQRAGQALGLDQARLAPFMADLWDEYLGQPNVALIKFFAGMRPRFKTAILSNSFVGARQREQSRYRFGDLCDLVIYSHEEGMEKPEPRFFELLCARLAVQPSRTIFLDDFEPHVVAARALGMQAILFRDTAQALAELNARLGATP